VLIHFDTLAGLAYTLQYTQSLPLPSSPQTVWTTVYQAPILPFPNHYIVVDTKADASRFYRLLIAP